MIRRTVAAICVTAAIATLAGISLTGITTETAIATGASSSPGGPGGGNNNGGDIPPDSPSDQAKKMEQACNEALGSLKKIPASMVAGFSTGGVNVAPVCDHGYGRNVPIDNSQAAPLIDKIALNPALVAALKARGYTPDDVVGVVIIKGVATLYVHHSRSTTGQ